MDDPARLALRIRLRAVRMVAPQGFGYLGQALSAAEQVAAVFAVLRPGQDRLVCSPGHYVIAPFAAAGELGLLDEDLLDAYGHNGVDPRGDRHRAVAGVRPHLRIAGPGPVRRRRLRAVGRG